MIVSCPTICQEALKKAEVNPSDPGDLFGLILSRVLAISSTDGGVERI